MLDYFFQMGPIGIPLVIVALLVAGLIVRRAVQLAGGGGREPEFQAGLNAVLFWGAFSALVGFLGQYSGMYNGLNAIAAADALSPFVIARGLAESFTTTLFGLVVFVIAALAWFLLGAWHRRTAGEGT